MPSIISAGTTANTGLNLTADTSGNLVFQTNGNTTAMTIDTSQNVTYANGVSFTGVIGGNGANISSMNASNLTSGTVDNARTTAASANGASTIVLRDASGAFSAGVITANGSGLTGISASNISTGTLAAARLPAGSVLQVVSVIKTDVFSTSTIGSYVDVTGLSVSITPTSSSSKILVMVTMNGVASDNSGARLLRGSTAIAIGDAAGSRIQGTMADFYLNNSGNSQKSFAKTFLDSPATTSSTTYKIQVQTPSGTFYVNSGNGDGDNVYNTRTVSTITLMEIAA